jgi:hypothetical protein
VGERLIRATAKLYLYRDTLQDDDRSQSMMAAMQFEATRLHSETQNRTPVTRFRVSSW